MAQAGLRVVAARQPLAAAIQPGGQLPAVAVAGSGHVGQVQERGVRRDTDRAEEHVLDQEWVPAVDLRVLVPVFPQQADQRQVPVVVPLGGPLAWVPYLAGVQAGVRAGLSHRDARQRAVPARGVVRALPRVIGGDQSRCLGIALGGEVAVPAHQPRVKRLDARADLRPLSLRCQLPDPPHRQGMDWRLADTGRLNRERRRRRRAGAVPPFGAGKVRLTRGRPEHDVRHHAGLPLRREQVLELREGPPDVQVRPSDRDEGAVPAPLVRIKVRCRLRPAARVIAVQHGGGLAAQQFGRAGGSAQGESPSSSSPVSGRSPRFRPHISGRTAR